MHGQFLNNWVPLKLLPDENGHLCRWLYVGNHKFTEPFFDDTILRCKRLPENNRGFRSASSLEMLPDWAADITSLEPTAFIFHVSRCGSTLLAQMLALDPRNVVLSEVPFLDEVLRLPFKKNGIDPEASGYYFKEALRFYARRKDTDESKLFIKLDSWHLLFYERIRNLFPSIPFVILYRSPAEIIRSQKRNRGMQSVPGLIEKDVFGFEENDLTPDLDLYMSKVLEKYFSDILRIIKVDSDLLLFNYNEGMMSIFDRFINHLGITTDEGYITKVRERMNFDGKQPSFFYQEEQPAPGDVAYLQKCMDLYKTIEIERMSMKPVKNKLQQESRS